MRKGVLAVAVFFLIVVGGRQLFGGEVSREARTARGAELRRLLRAVEGADEEPARTFKTSDGYLRFIGAGPATHFAVAAGTGEQQAETFLATWRNIFVNESAGVAFEQKRVKAANGRTYIRYRQTYSDLEVFGAEMGHEVRKGVGSFGGYQGIWAKSGPRRYFGGSDPRKDGCAIGY